MWNWERAMGTSVAVAEKAMAPNLMEVICEENKEDVEVTGLTGK